MFSIRISRYIVISAIIFTTLVCYQGCQQQPQSAIAAEIKIGWASFYGLYPEKEKLNKNVAMGFPFSKQLLECAMWDVPLGTVVKVTNLKNNKFVYCRVTDRGPARHLDRLIDLTVYAFSQIAELRQGLVKVKVEIVR